ncbi:hypothetical protein FT663_00457 [Candidozyma haemuli var. vulneris]|nr:hypothetical protein FT662_00563 [[Candida] haemuloni var. vulneris]KAF3995404.1 hypothetical protein FT663_00457 [[Candida] haemuloni var. vulneris]
MEKRSRKRAPISCLSCKKRKVRCDRKRPCTGCVKNNVGHLCVYVEPNWVDDEVKKAAGTQGLKDDVRTSAEYVELKAAMEKTIAAQRNEIEALRAQISNSSRTDLDKASVSNGSVHSPSSETTSYVLSEDAAASAISILRKLDTTDTQTSTPEVLDDNFYSLKGFRYSKKSKCSETFVAKLYSWLNIIKLDPQLTGLWYKITNLQKSYHMYKTSLLSKYPRSEPTVYGDNGCPVTGGSHEHGPSCGHHQCPVVACEFNLMVEESSNRVGTPMSRSHSMRIKNEPTDYSQINQNDTSSVISSLQKLWTEIISYGRGSEQMQYDQLVFLINFYLNISNTPSSISSYELESRNLFRFYHDDILSLFRRVGNQVELDLSSLDAKVSEAEVISFARLKGIYLSMLGLMVEEALDVLRSRTGKADETSKAFHEVFPLEAVHQGLGYKRTNVHDSIREFLESFSSSQQNYELSSSLPCLAVFMGFLNRCIALYIKPGNTSDIRSCFTSILTKMLDMLDKDDSRLRLWADPSHIRFNGANMSVSRQKELRLHLSHMWVDFMRIINHVTFNTVPMHRHSDKLDKMIESYFENIHEATENQDHLKFVSKQKSDPGDDSIAELLASLHVYYLSSKIFLTLRKSTCRSSGSNVTVADLQRLTKEIAAWIEDFSLTKLRMSRYFEVRSMFQYLDFYISFIVFLQCEEDLDYESVCQILPLLFTKGLDLINFLQESVKQFSKNTGSQYILGAVAEILSRVSHLIVGLLIRFKRDESGDGADSNETPAPSSLVYTAPSDNMRPFTIPVQQKEQLITSTDSVLMLLENSLNRDSFSRVSKMWKFYMTFVRNSHRMNPAAYARIHADVFKSGKLMDTCPVLPSPAKVAAAGDARRASKGMPNKCPVSHQGGGFEAFEPFSASPRTSFSRNGSVTDTSSQFSRVKDEHNSPSTEPRKRMCPFDHESLRGNTKTPSFHESNIRRSPCGDVNPPVEAPPPPPLKRPSPKPNGFPPMMPAPPMSIPPFQMPQPSPMSGAMDWDTLPNFNFDLFPDETLMVQFGPGDLNNPNIEGMFQ